MLTVDAALAKVLEQSEVLSSAEVPALDALGLVLAERITSDVDSPPHDKSIVDGYALRSADFESGVREFEVLEEITAGQVPTRNISPGQSTRIMTGAPIPHGADAVVMIERASLTERDGHPARVLLDVDRLSPGQNIMRQASSMQRCEAILAPGVALRSIELGMLAEVGRTSVRVTPRPLVAVLATGDELVTVASVPAAGQIRNSNGPMLIGSARQAGGSPVDLGLCGDQNDVLTERIRQGLESNVLLLSGGVSAGVLDLVPGVLQSLGVQQIFHKVNLKPGKPLWFGVRVRDGRKSLVFGLPGNPVSSLVCFELFVRPAIRRLAGHTILSLRRVRARLASPFQQRGDRPTYFPSQLDQRAGKHFVTPLAWKGSGDLRTLLAANALALFPAGEHSFPAGHEVDALLLPPAS
jgi:molybdopterin molybdotransferase